MTKLIDLIGFFTTVPESVIERIPEIGTDSFCLFVYLRYRTNRRRGEAFPSYAKIQTDLGGWSSKRVSAAIKGLESAGLVERERRFGKSTIYRLTIASPSGAEELEDHSPSGAEETVLPERKNNSSGTEDKPDLKESDLKLTEIGYPQNDLIPIKAGIRDKMGGGPYRRDPPNYKEFFEPLIFAGYVDNYGRKTARLICVGADPEAQREYLSDKKSLFLAEGWRLQGIDDVSFIVPAEIQE